MVFCFVQDFFFGRHHLSRKADFFFQNSTLGYMTKTQSDYFFSLHQNQNIFFSNIVNQNIFLEKNHNPPPFKLNGRSLIVDACWYHKEIHKYIIVMQPYPTNYFRENNIFNTNTCIKNSNAYFCYFECVLSSNFK